MIDKADTTTTAPLMMKQVSSTENSVLNSVDKSRKKSINNKNSKYFDIPTPEYLKKTYHWSYLNPRNVKILDSEWIVKLILWWQHNKLCRATFSEIKPASSVLQVAAVYGDFSRKLSEHIGSDGELKLIDVAAIQVLNTQEKLANYPHVRVCQADAATLKDKEYDVVLCYFLLHEIPDDYKTRVVDNLLNHIKTDGKLIIVDYHKPHWAHPVKPVTSLVFDWLEPYAKTLWRRSIRNLASEPDYYEWKKSKYFGGLFQKVVVVKKASF